MVQRVTPDAIATDAVTAAEIASGAVDTDELAADAVTGAEIEDNVVAGEHIDLASEADGDIMYRSGGVWVRLAKGTTLQELRMNAGATAPEWFTPDGGVLRFISETDISAGADDEFLFTDLDQNKAHIFVFSEIVSTSASGLLNLRTSTGSGSMPTIDTSASYDWLINSARSDNVTAVSSGNNDTDCVLHAGLLDATRPLGGVVMLDGLASGKYLLGETRFYGKTNSTALRIVSQGIAQRNDTDAVVAVAFLTSNATNLTAGFIRHYTREIS